MQSIRTVRLNPYRAGMGPTFTLRMFDTGRTDYRGCTVIAYRLSQRDHGKSTIIFDDADFCGSPLHADDSDATVAALLSFLTLRHGDTDSDYFAGYGTDQLAFCAQHAEALGFEAMSRFGEV